jgi:hypothetical protein
VQDGCTINYARVLAGRELYPKPGDWHAFWFNLRIVMIDVHCHILAEVDDGPKSWDISEEMCRMAAADGTEHIVATPHANHRYEYDREYLTRVLDYLRQRVGDSPRLSLGCDFHLSYENVQDAMVHPERYVIESSRYLLVELSNYSIPVQIAETFTNHSSGTQSALAAHAAGGSAVGGVGLCRANYRVRFYRRVGRNGVADRAMAAQTGCGTLFGQ